MHFDLSYHTAFKQLMRESICINTCQHSYVCILSTLQHCCTGAPIDCRKVRGSTPLMVATIAGHTAAVTKLLEHKANVHAASKRGATALACASSLAHKAIAREPIAHSAAMDAIDREYSTPLHRALAQRHTGTVIILVAAGANLELADKYGRTAIVSCLTKTNGC
jgi:ankyrin repeat protein